VPMFEEIFRHAPDGYEPTRDYLMDWDKAVNDNQLRHRLAA
jgi:hypothetical protein